MHPILKNKFVRFGGIGVGILVTLFILFFIVVNLFTSSTGILSNSFDSISLYSNSGGVKYEQSVRGTSYGVTEDSYGKSAPYYPPIETPNGYTSELEKYETSSYSVSAQTHQFDELCTTVTNLRSNSQIHFKIITSGTNYCNAIFFVEENTVANVLSTLDTFENIEINRTTESVTRHKTQLQGRTSILQQQLASVQRSLTAAETQFDEIADFARQSRDAVTLSKAIREKLSLIDTLTQRKISLTSQLNNLYRQSADLEERMNVVQFSVNISRSQPINIGEYSRKWDSAWKELKDEYTNTLIGLTAYFGIFLLWTIRTAIYLLVTLVVIRGLWKFIKLLWKKKEGVVENDSQQNNQSN